MKNSSLLFIIPVICLSISCCPKGNEADKFSSSNLSFIIEDAASGKNMYSIPSHYPQYHPDSLAVTGYPLLLLDTGKVTDGYAFLLRNYYNPAVDGPGEQTRAFYTRRYHVRVL
jgi:hypothetical protein